MIPTFHPKHLVLFLPLFCALSFIGCEKKKDIVKHIIYDFSYTGSPYVGKVIHFANTSSGVDKFIWSFGDGTVAFVAKPYHTYTAAGIYKVSLVINDDTSSIVKRSLSVGCDSFIMASLGGTKLYSYFSEGFESGKIISHYTYPDTMITIKIIDPATVSIGSDSLHFSSFANEVVTFTGPTQIPYYYYDEKQTLSFNTVTNHFSFKHYLRLSGHYSCTNYYDSK